ncbi:MAG: cytochrome c [Actinobacteria bacterium]|nr:cytochrome c [Actinomycetota bacterium]
MFKRIVTVIEVLALLAAGVFVVMLFVANPDSTTGATAPSGNDASYSPEGGGLPDGAALYSARCAGCHGSDGGGGSGPRLAGRVVEEFPDAADEVAVVTKGRGGMPGFGSSLAEAEILAIVEYTRTELGR